MAVKILDNKGIERILLRSVNWIGDAVMTTPAMGALRAAFPRAEILVAANPPVAELFDAHPYCDRVLVYDRKKRHAGVSGVLRFAGELRRERIDVAILLQNAVEAALLVSLAGIPRRAGYRTDGRGLLLTHGVPVGDGERRLHHTEYYLRMLEQLGIHGGDHRLRLHCTDQERAWAREKLGPGAWLAINPGAAYGSAKRWIPERFAEVADRLADEFGLKVLLTGGPGETEIGRDIEKAMRQRPLNLIGHTNVRQLMALLAGCRLMVTNDSGPMHVAAAFGVPIVAVFGPTDHTTTSPLGDACRIVRADVGCAPCLLRQCPTDHRCMEAVTAEAVLRQARELLMAPA
ncbi:MAG: lipopolysaccharide heptosyltransferase II [Desulfuromonadales bacterium]